jgi:hypothetical protein
VIVSFFANVTLSGVPVETISNEDRLSLEEAVGDCMALESGEHVWLEETIQLETTKTMTTTTAMKTKKEKERNQLLLRRRTTRTRRQLIANHSDLALLNAFQIIDTVENDGQQTPQDLYQTLSTSLAKGFSDGTFLVFLATHEQEVGSSTFQGTTVLDWSISDPIYIYPSSTANNGGAGGNGSNKLDTKWAVAIALGGFFLLLLAGLAWKYGVYSSTPVETVAGVPVATLSSNSSNAATAASGAAAGGGESKEEGFDYEAVFPEQVAESPKNYHPFLESKKF